jgi:peptidyl-prolyl cis-trans isomerase B (cyclophilin B)
VPSEKRQRQRERREIKVAAEQVRAKRNKRARTIIGAVIVAGLVVGFIALFSSNTPKKKAAAGTTTTVPATTSTTSTTIPAAVAPVCPPAGGSKTRVINFTKAPPVCIPTNGVYNATFTTDVGAFVVQMHAASSLAAVNDVVFLARYRFYDGTVFHRVIPGFVVQGGDPTGTGSGPYPGYSFTGNTPPKSCTAKKDCYATGDVAMANSGAPSSDGSQFFIILPGGAPALTDVYTVIGHVISGMSVVEAIGKDGGTAANNGIPAVLHKLKSVTITQVS